MVNWVTAKCPNHHPYTSTKLPQHHGHMISTLALSFWKGLFQKSCGLSSLAVLPCKGLTPGRMSKRVILVQSFFLFWSFSWLCVVTHINAPNQQTDKTSAFHRGVHTSLWSIIQIHLSISGCLLLPLLISIEAVRMCLVFHKLPLHIGFVLFE